MLLKARTAAASELEYTIFNSASVGKELRSTRLFTRNAKITAKGIRTKVGFTFEDYGMWVDEQRTEMDFLKLRKTA